MESLHVLKAPSYLRKSTLPGITQGIFNGLNPKVDLSLFFYFQQMSTGFNKHFV